MSKKNAPNIIATNKKAYHDFHIGQQLEAGLVLTGWEIKSIRANRVQLRDSYVIFKAGEAWLIGGHITPLPNIAEHVHADPQRSRKLLLKAREISKLFTAVQQQGYTVISLNLHWHNRRVKLSIALGKGKKSHDKRQTLKQRDWEREKQYVLKGRRN